MLFKHFLRLDYQTCLKISFKFYTSSFNFTECRHENRIKADSGEGFGGDFREVTNTLSQI